MFQHISLKEGLFVLNITIISLSHWKIINTIPSSKFCLGLGHHYVPRPRVRPSIQWVFNEQVFNKLVFNK